RRFDLLLTEKIHHVTSAPLKHVRLVKITDGTSLMEIAGTRPSDPPAAAQDFRLGRRAHARLLHRLADAGVKPKAITFDVVFHHETFWDKELADAMHAMAPIPIIIGDRSGGRTGPDVDIVASK